LVVFLQEVQTLSSGINKKTKFVGKSLEKFKSFQNKTKWE